MIIILSPEKTNIPVNLVPLFNDPPFLFYCFLKSGVKNELKLLFLLKSKKSQAFLFKIGQNFAARTMLVWSAYVCRIAVATLLKTRVIYELGGHFNRIRFI